MTTTIVRLILVLSLLGILIWLTFEAFFRARETVKSRDSTSQPPGSQPPGSQPPESQPPESQPPESQPPESINRAGRARWALAAYVAGAVLVGLLAWSGTLAHPQERSLDGYQDQGERFGALIRRDNVATDDDRFTVCRQHFQAIFRQGNGSEQLVDLRERYFLQGCAGENPAAPSPVGTP